MGVISPLSSEQTGPVPFLSQTCPRAASMVAFPSLLPFFSLKFLSKEFHGVTDAKSSWGEVELCCPSCRLGMLLCSMIRGSSSAVGSSHGHS